MIQDHLSSTGFSTMLTGTTFKRFLGLGLRLEDRVPDATTLWLYREALAKAARKRFRGAERLAKAGRLVVVASEVVPLDAGERWRTGRRRPIRADCERSDVEFCEQIAA